MTAAIITANLGYIALTFIPPILWLLFYLREDRHPEPKRLLFLVFIGGMASTLLAIVGECIFIRLFGGSCSTSTSPNLSPLVLFFGIALIEEYVKYFTVKTLVLRKPDFNEPVDAMIYMMTAALGFAALENTLFIFPLFQQSFLAGLEITASRFLGANLLHALSSGIVGFFLARAFFSPRRHHFIALGILIATVLHTLFNFFILIRGEVSQATGYVVVLLLIMAIMVFINFEKLKKTSILTRRNP